MHKYKSALKFQIILLVLLLTIISLYQNCGEGFELAEGFNNNSSLAVTYASCAINATAAPDRLSDTCYSQISAGHNNLRPYEPQYPLYSDGAAKNRWVYLSNQFLVDTTNLDEWTYPVGTILWKDFLVSARKVETRMLEKVFLGTGAASWRSTVYVWRADQLEADKTDNAMAPTGMTYEFTSVPNYKLLATSQCIMCHQSSTDYVLGFNALQLSDTNRPGHLMTWSNYLLTAVALQAIPGTAQDKAAIGYMTSNCATCHSPLGIAAGVGMNLKFNSAATTLAATNTYITTVASMNPTVIPGNVAGSRLHSRFMMNMPPRNFVGNVDPVGEAALREWILSLVP